MEKTLSTGCFGSRYFGIQGSEFIGWFYSQVGVSVLWEESQVESKGCGCGKLKGRRQSRAAVGGLETIMELNITGFLIIKNLMNLRNTSLWAVVRSRQWIFLISSQDGRRTLLLETLGWNWCPYLSCISWLTTHFFFFSIIVLLSSISAYLFYGFDSLFLSFIMVSFFPPLTFWEGWLLQTKDINREHVWVWEMGAWDCYVANQYPESTKLQHSSHLHWKKNYKEVTIWSNEVLGILIEYNDAQLHHHPK